MNDVSAAREADAVLIASLLERIQAGDREAFVTVIRLYQRKVFVMAYSILRDREDALDAVQETFLKLYQKAGLYKPGNSFQGWLLQMAKNISIDSYRKHRRKRRQWETATPLEDIPVAGRCRPADRSLPVPRKDGRPIRLGHRVPSHGSIPNTGARRFRRFCTALK